MYTDYGYFEEDRLGKPHDLKLLLRLYPFSRPYLSILALSVVLVVLITIFDLALPYITKIAIDRYIVPWAAPRHADKVHPAEENSRRLQVDLTTDETAVIAGKYPGLFIGSGDAARISYEDLSKLRKEDLRALRRNDRKGVGRLALIFVGIVLAGYGCTFIQIVAMEYAGQRIMHDLRVRLYTHIQGLSLAFFTRNPLGRLVTRVTNDIQNMNELFTSVITFVFKDIFLLIGIAGVLLSINWRLALVSFAIIPVVVVVSAFFSGRARDVFRVLRTKIAEINTRLSESIGGMMVIHLFNRQTENYQQFMHLNHEHYLASTRQVRVFALFMPAVELLGIVAIAVVIYHGGGKTLAGDLSLGELVAFMSYLRMFFQPIRDIAEKYHILQNAMASAERIFQLLDTRENREAKQRPPGESGVVPTRRNGSGSFPQEALSNIVFKAVSFSYTPDEPVLDRISFRVDSGETLAVVGPTGSGKTTLLNLIPRFYDPVSGAILINNRDIRTLPLSAVRSKMAIVMQEPFLFSDTIRNNITFGKRGLSKTRLDHLLKVSHCESLVAKMPRGVDTVLTEAAASLSSGERQLISIARALACDPELILFDEATSYIDSDTEKKIQDALITLMEGRTCILVAHRLSTARNATRIVVLNRGRIVESGSHDELMDRKGFYFGLAQIQNQNR